MKKCTQEKIELIKKLYNSGMTQKDIANQLNCSQTGISTIMRRNNIQTRDINLKTLHILYHDINLNFFKTIDTSEKAYFLGLMYADGNIHYDNINNCYAASILLKSDDKIILEKFRDLVCPSYQLKIDNHNRTYFRMNRKEICDQLIALGCGPRKSLILQFPTCIPHNLMSHFLRGMTDGDGTITQNKQKLVKSTGQRHINHVWKIISSISFCQSMKSYLLNELNINSSIYIFKTKMGTELATITVGGNLQAYKALSWLYQDATTYLPRKYNKYLELKKYINLKYPNL